MMRRIDLLPERYVARRRERRNIGVIVIAGLVALLLFLTYWFILGAQVASEKDDLEAARQRNAQLRADISELQVFAELQAEVATKRGALTTVMTGDIAWPALLTEIAMVIPGEVWLTSFEGSAGATEGANPVGTETAPVRITTKTTTGRIHFQGNSLTMPGIAKWLVRQSSVNRFAAVWLNNAVEEDNEETIVFSFDSTLELSNKALSNRFVEDLP